MQATAFKQFFCVDKPVPPPVWLMLSGFCNQHALKSTMYSKDGLQYQTLTTDSTQAVLDLMLLPD